MNMSLVLVLPRKKGGRRPAHRLDAGDGPQRVGRVAIERVDARSIVAVEARVDVEERQVVRVEPDVDVPQVLQRSEKQPGADQQHEGDRDLRHEQHAPHGRASAGDAAAGFLHRRGEIDARRTQSRDEAEDESGEHAQCRDECDDPPVDRRVAAEGQQLTAPVADDHAEQAAEHGEKDALGEELTNQPRAWCAERQPQRDFPPAARRAREQEIGDVRADDQQHQRDDNCENRRRTRGAGVDVINAARARFDQQLRHGLPVLISREQALLGSDRGVERRPAVARGILEHRAEVRAHLIERRARLEPAHRLQPPVGGLGQTLLAAELRIERERQRDVTIRRAAQVLHPQKFLRHDTDDRHENVVHADDLADDLGIGREPARPERVADHRDRRGRRLIVSGRERPAEQRRDAEYLKVVARTERGRREIGVAVDDDVHRAHRRGSDDVGQILVGREERLVNRVRDGRARALLVEAVVARAARHLVLAGPAQADERLRLRHWKRP